MIEFATSLLESGMMEGSTIEKIVVCRVLSIHKFSMLDLVEMEVNLSSNLVFPNVGSSCYWRTNVRKC